jgi:hypothetical protein
MNMLPLLLKPGADLRRALEGWIGKQGKQPPAAIALIALLAT